MWGKRKEKVKNIQSLSSIYRILFLTKIKQNEGEGFPWWSSGKEFTCQCRKYRFDPRSRRSRMQPSCVPQFLSCAPEPRSCNY